MLRNFDLPRLNKIKLPGVLGFWGFGGDFSLGLRMVIGKGGRLRL
jgi:hypothetical protein